MNYSPIPQGLLPIKTLDSHYLQRESLLGKIIDLKVGRQQTLANEG
jgi:hypothetical protein